MSSTNSWCKRDRYSGTSTNATLLGGCKLQAQRKHTHPEMLARSLGMLDMSIDKRYARKVVGVEYALLDIDIFH